MNITSILLLLTLFKMSTPSDPSLTSNLLSNNIHKPLLSQELQPPLESAQLNMNIDDISTTENYCACNNPGNPLCRQYVNQGNCRKRKRCCFYHPEAITPIIAKQAKRQLGFCYCGSPQRRIINHRAFKNSNVDDSIPKFFAVCSRTGRSMRQCM